MEPTSPISFLNTLEAQLIPEILIKDGGVFLFVLALTLFAFSLFVFRYHLSRFSVHKLRALRAELIYITGSVISLLIMAGALISL
jgi:prolipoprotein diacylglyceryltransferase